MFALYEKATGRIRQYQSCPDCPDDQTGSLDIGDEYRGVAENYYVTEGAIMQRPTKPTIPITGVTPLLLTLPAADITITKEAGDAIQMKGGDLLLRDAGGYTLTVTAPFPRQSFTQRIEVRHD